MSQPFVAAKVLRAHHPLLRARVRSCGDLFRFETHHEDRDGGIGLRVTCLCPEGHGVARRPETFWMEPYMGRYDLVVLGAERNAAGTTEGDAAATSSAGAPTSVHPLAPVRAA